MNQTNLQFKTLLLLLALVTVAFIWILLPSYGAVLWAVILGIIFAPMQRRLQQRFSWNRNLTSLTRLDLENNELTTLPLGIAEHFEPRDRRLYTDGNQLS